MNHVTHPLSSTDISIFSPGIVTFCNIKKYRYRFHFDLTLSNFFESLRIVLVNMVTILMMPTRMAALGLLKIKLF